MHKFTSLPILAASCLCLSVTGGLAQSGQGAAEAKFEALKSQAIVNGVPDGADIRSAGKRPESVVTILQRLVGTDGTSQEVFLPTLVPESPTWIEAYRDAAEAYLSDDTPPATSLLDQFGIGFDTTAHPPDMTILRQAIEEAVDAPTFNPEVEALDMATEAALPQGTGS